MKSLLITLRKRWLAESPKLFKKITNIGVTMTTLGGSILAYEYIDSLADWLKESAKMLCSIGLPISLVSKITVKDTKEVEGSNN